MSDYFADNAGETSGLGYPRKIPTDRAQAEELCLGGLVPNYALLFFDHLHSEYLTLKARIEDQELVALLDGIHAKRLKCDLTWSDIYTFDLALLNVRPLENLVRKAYDARARYRSIAGQKEYDEYLASKPPDLTSILIAPTTETPAQAASATSTTKAAEPVPPVSGDESEVSAPIVEPNATAPTAPAEGSTPASETDKSATPRESVAPAPVDEPNTSAPSPKAKMPFEFSQSSEIVQRVLRADISYLLSKFYLYYAMLPMRESLREDLTARAVHMTKWILMIIVSLIVASFGGTLFLERFTKFDLRGAFGLTVGSVAFAGIVGGCVSMLQRIQSTPSEGDALFNLASLTNGWRGLSLSPLYGGIFASLLFILFAAGILEGSVFPKINTPGKLLPPTRIEQTSTPQQSQPQQQAQQAALTPATPTPTPPTETQKLGILQITDFLKGTGPTDGVSFALLIVWSFIAGFAERFVPDTLNRLVAKNEAIQGTNS